MKKNHGSSSYSENDLIDLRSIFTTWMKWSWILIPLILIGLYFGYRDLQRFASLYEAKITVKGNSDVSFQATINRSREAALLSAFTGVTERSVSLGSENFSRLQLLIGSQMLAERLDKKYDLLVKIFSTNWDAEKKSWIIPSGKDFERSQARKLFFKQPLWSKPNTNMLAEYLKASILFEETEEGFVDVIFLHKDKMLAKEYLELIYFEADALLREEDQKLALEKRSYLLNKLSLERKVELREVLFSLLKDEENKLMLLDSSEPYAAKIMQPIFVSDAPTSPNIRFVFGVPVFISIFIGFAILTLYAIFVRESYSER
mgnify:CR=1 FL=1